MKRTPAATPILLLALAWTQVLPPSIALAAPADGVRCPNGFETRYDSGQKTMRCERNITTHRPAVCDPVAAEHVLYRAAKGNDFCVRPGDATLAPPSIADGDSRRRPVVCSADTSDGTRWQLEIDATGDRDRCRATRTEWIYPSQQ